MTVADKLVMFFLLILAIAAIIFQGFFMSGDKGERVVITVNNKEYAGYNFSDIEEKTTLEIETEYGKNTVVIDQGSVWVSQADCPDKLDIKAGRISKTNQMIVCLPNRLMIEIKDDAGKVDKVTY